MRKSATLHRHLCIIRMLDKPYTYPSISHLADRLAGHGFEVAGRTIERDLQELRRAYGFNVVCKNRNGQKAYHLAFAPDEDVSDFRAFINLLERRERLEFLSESIGSGRAASRYLQLEASEHFSGQQPLADLWNALLLQRVVCFTYQPYTDSPPTERTVEPGLLFEYRNRWYLSGWCIEKKGLRTFGLDRMRELTITDQLCTGSRLEECRTHRNHVIGVTTPAGKPVERVVLRFTAQEGKYVRSLPMHASQQILEENGQTLTIALRVIPNHELEREILGYGQEVVVLEPAELRESIQDRLRKTLESYSI